MDFKVLTLPGWQSSGPGHWQTLWEAAFGDERVEQHDWLQPLRGDWIARLEEVLLRQPQPVLLAAHSLGCHLVAAWAAHSQQTARVAGALLVAPPDVSRENFPPQLHRWSPTVLKPLPFPTLLAASTDDPYCTFEAAADLARHWGVRVVDVGARGHVNSESGLGDWPEGRAWLTALPSLPHPTES